MAAVITLTGNGVSAGTQNTTATTVMKITGDLKGGRIKLEASNEDARYAQVMPDMFFDQNKGNIQCFAMSFPANTYFRASLDGATGTASARVVMW